MSARILFYEYLHRKEENPNAEFSNHSMIMVLCFGILTVISGIVGVIKINDKAYAGVKLANMLFFGQVILLIGVMQRSWLALLLGLLCLLALAIVLILRGLKNA